MIEFNRPMLAAPLLKPADPHTDAFIYQRMKELKYRVMATLKKDGIRAIKLGDLASRTIKKIPNVSISERAKKLPYGFDMELWNSELTYDQVESIVMSREHIDQDKIQFHVLDWWSSEREDLPYIDRVLSAAYCCEQNKWPDVVPPTLIECCSAYELLSWFKQFEEDEGEGICFRLPDSPYKQGRSTLREQYLVKLCRSIRSECTIIGFEEQMFNSNAEKRNAVGMMDRSKVGAGMIGKCTLGAFLVRDEQGLEFRVGSGVGLTNAKRAEIWDNQDKWLGTKIVIKSKNHGVKVKPRSPIYVGRRSEIDL